MISFGKLAINNPDLPERFKNSYPLNTDYDIMTWMNPLAGAKGYTEFSAYKK